MIHVAVFHPLHPQRVECVRVFAAAEDAPSGSVLVSNFGQIGAPPSQHAEMRQSGGVLYWSDPRTEAQAWADVRASRDALLAACDWITVRAIEQGQPVPTAWATYRQALRDITEQADPFGITWPTAPP